MTRIDFDKNYDGMTRQDLINLVKTLQGLGWSDDRIILLLEKYEQAEDYDGRRDQSV